MKISNLIPLIILGILIAYSLDDSPSGSRKLGKIGRWLSKAGKKVGHALGNVGKAMYENSPIKQAVDFVKDPKKFAKETWRNIKGLGKDIYNYGKETGEAFDSALHGDLKGAYHHAVNAVDPLVVRGGDLLTGGSVSAFERASGRQALDLYGQAMDFGQGMGRAVDDFSHGDIRGGLGEVFDTATPYIQAAEDAETGGFAHTINETMGENVTTDPFAFYDVSDRLVHGDQDTWEDAENVGGQYIADRVMDEYGNYRAARRDGLAKKYDGLAKYDRR